MEKRLLLGTMNQAKVNIIRAAVESLPIKVLTLGDLNINVDVREDGQSTEENAAKKARAYFAVSRVPTLAIDGGLLVNKFPAEKQPETFVRRIYGTNRDATDDEILEYYQKELEGVGGESVGTWQGAMALILAPKKVYSDTFFFEAILTTRRMGKVIPGAPLDSLMVDPATGRYYSEMTWKERPHTRRIYEFVKQHIKEL